MAFLRTRPDSKVPSHERPRAPHWMQRFIQPRQQETLPIVLHRRRIYVLPTRYGLFFALLLSAMTLGSLNYNNNPALILCFMLLSLMLSVLLRAYLNLSGVRLEAVEAAPVHAGEQQRLRFRFSADSRSLRDGLILERDGERAGFHIIDAKETEASLLRTTQRRGLQPVGRFKLYSEQPLGLFHVWTWLHPDSAPLVWPALEKDPPSPPGQGGGNDPQRQPGHSDEIAALRNYRQGDPLRQIAWKHSAKRDRLLVREYEKPSGNQQLLSWDALAPMPSDARAKRLARWLLEADRAGDTTLLLMPNGSIGPSHGITHLHACFRALALAP